MKSYLEFINESNESNEGLEELCMAIDNIKSETEDFKLNYSEAAAEQNFFKHYKLNFNDLDNNYEKFKNILESNGFSLDVVKKIYNNNKDRFKDSADYAVPGTWPYGFYSDLLFYEVSNKEFELSGLNIKSEGSDRLLKYDYGWHTTKYGKLVIEQQLGSTDNFIKNILTDSYKDDFVYHQRDSNSEIIAINEYYFKTDDEYIDESFDGSEGFYVYKINEFTHVLSHLKPLVDGSDNFKIIIREALKEMPSEDLIEFIKTSKFPKDVEIDFKNTELNSLYKSIKGIKKFNI